MRIEIKIMNTTREEKMYENMNKNEKSNNFMDGNWLKEWFIL
jgi:hypothetical protein